MLEGERTETPLSVVGRMLPLLKSASPQMRVTSERFAPVMVVHEPGTMPAWNVAPFTTLEIEGPFPALAGGSRYMITPASSHQRK